MVKKCSLKIKNRNCTKEKKSEVLSLLKNRLFIFHIDNVWIACSQIDQKFYFDVNFAILQWLTTLIYLDDNGLDLYVKVLKKNKKGKEDILKLELIIRPNFIAMAFLSMLNLPFFSFWKPCFLCCFNFYKRLENVTQK